MPRRPPQEDCIVNWATDPSKGKRLLDWLDTHKEERNVLFTTDRHRVHVANSRFTKPACSMRAAVAIFACDSNAVLSERVVKDPGHFGKVVTDHIRNGWKKKYQKFNSQIGPAGANLRYKDIRVGGTLHNKIEKLMATEFPEWSRLHVYWRTNPYFNQYYKPGKRRASEAGQADVQQMDSHKYIMVEDVSSPENSSDNENENVEAQSSATTSVKVKYEHIELKRPLKEDDDSDDATLTKAQRHELRMEKIRLERQKLDIQQAQLEADACRRREKHEIMLQLMAFVNGDMPGRGNNMEGPKSI